MAFQPVVNTVAIDVLFTQHSEPMQNVFYAELDGGYVLADLAALALRCAMEVDGGWQVHQAIETVFVRVEVRGLAVINDLLATDNTGNGAGANVSGALPNNVTFAVKKESGLTGRSARGRCYWIGTPSGKLLSTNENEITTSYVADVIGAVDGMRLAIASVGLWKPVLVSRFTGGLPRATGKTFPWISTVAVDNVIDSQRGRLPQ